MTTEEEKAETCRVAMKAAVEAVNDYCGSGEPEHGRYIKFAGGVIEYPDSVHDIVSGPELPGDEQVEEIAETAWAEETARALCERVSNPDLDSSEVDACVKRLRTTLANEVLFHRLKLMKKE